jgi:hypothetical protein
MQYAMMAQAQQEVEQEQEEGDEETQEAPKKRQLRKD